MCNITGDSVVREVWWFRCMRWIYCLQGGNTFHTQETFVLFLQIWFLQKLLILFDFLRARSIIFPGEKSDVSFPTYPMYKMMRSCLYFSEILTVRWVWYSNVILVLHIMGYSKSGMYHLLGHTPLLTHTLSCPSGIGYYHEHAIRKIICFNYFLLGGVM